VRAESQGEGKGGATFVVEFPAVRGSAK
jgi:hypothetical protein